MRETTATLPRSRAWVLGALLVATPLAAQRGAGEDDDAWRADPYTAGEAEAMERAGIVSYGPFVFSDDHDTVQVEHVLGARVRMRWLETAHFRIGSSLGRYLIPRTDKKERAKLRAELERLEEKLPRVRPRTRALDPWLRVHLVAQRAEDLYAELSERLGVTDASFPRPGEDQGEGPAMGKGPYLGQPGKYVILVFRKASSLGHYSRTFLGRQAETSLRFNFVPTGSLLYATAVEFSEGTHRTETGLHAQMVYSLCHNLVDGYRFYSHRLPPWWTEGLAHYHARRVDERIHNVGDVRYDIDQRMAWDWPPRVRARVRHGIHVPAAELLRMRDPAEMTLIHHMMAWSRVDYLLTLGDEGFRVFMNTMKGPIPSQGLTPTFEEILARQEEALERAWGLDLDGFDAKWTAWVRKHYRAEKRR